MNKTPTIAVVTDSTCDLSQELAAARGIEIVPLNVHFGESVYADQVDITTDEFMTRMANSEKLPTTSQPSVGAFEETFRSLLDKGYSSIICLTISSKLSGTFQSAYLAAQNMANDATIEVIDTATGSYGLGFQVLRAQDLVDAGEPFIQIVDTLRNEIGRYHVVFFVETLEHLRRGGRIGKAAQLVGTVLQLKPLLRVDEGQIVPFERTRTRGKAIKALAAFAQEAGAAEDIAVLYNTTPDDAQALADMVSVNIPEKTPTVAKIGPVIATHLGPDILGVVVKERVSD